MDRRQIVTSSDQPAPLDKDGNPLPTISLEKYITKARESMVANSETWQGVIDRIGRWVDFKGAYRTMDKNFMESVWWAFKQLYEAGKIYEGEKVLRSEEHTSELQSRENLVCRLLLEKKKTL